MEILKVEHLVKQYGKGDNAVLAVNDISFSVEQGEFVAIVGSSGSGNSTSSLAWRCGQTYKWKGIYTG